MSRTVICWDNAPMETFWVSLKTELVHHRRFSTREKAQREISEYIEILCNHIRERARPGAGAESLFVSMCPPKNRGHNRRRPAHCQQCGAVRRLHLYSLRRHVAARSRVWS